MVNFFQSIDAVEIFDVAPRDGLQPEPDFIPTSEKIKLIELIADAGCKKIEIASFTHPKWIPQMRDAKAVCNGITRREGVVYNALVPNLRGLELAMECGLDEVVTILSTSESHNKKNLNMSIDDSLREIEKINSVAGKNGVRVRSYIATVFGCPMEGNISREKAIELAMALEGFGSYEISLGDTTGMANPASAHTIPKTIKGKLSKAGLAVHFHKYHGLEFANNFAALQAGITRFDCAVGGLGGCPYAPGAKGNTQTEILVEMFSRMGISTGINLERIYAAGKYGQSLSTLLTQACH
ncbi:MAG: hydroxymethylglutaryl-CoA lyase [Planctomycetota bacterium]|jgi:hydroxymethylglutaryl-CoA lyase|nr:hydroxymethylglutaryl-CoA lyase [Planctomycetota bacterium]